MVTKEFEFRKGTTPNPFDLIVFLLESVAKEKMNKGAGILKKSYKVVVTIDEV